MNKDNKPANLYGLSPQVQALVKAGYSLHKAMSLSMLKDKQPIKKKK